jgi:hypothetical protein
MATRAEQYRFKVKEDAKGKPWLVAEPAAGAGLEVGNIGFRLRPTATSEDAHEVAEFMNLWITELVLW